MSLFALNHRDRLAARDHGDQAEALVNEFDNLTAQLSAWALVSHNEDGTHNTLTTEGKDGVPVGAMVTWLPSIAPAGWLFCDGSAVSRADFPKLFKVLGISQGAGDGTTTFNIPNQFHTIILAA